MYSWQQRAGSRPRNIRVTQTLFKKQSNWAYPVIAEKLFFNIIDLSAPQITGSPTLYTPSAELLPVSQEVPLLGSVSQTYEPSISLQPVSVTAPLLTNASTVYSASISLIAVSMTVPKMDNSQTLYGPGITELQANAREYFYGNSRAQITFSKKSTTQVSFSGGSRAQITFKAKSTL